MDNHDKYFLGLEGELIEATKGELVKIAFIGCGSHSYRNIFPCFQFLPVDIVALCDISKEKAELFGRKFGAKKAYTDYMEMIKNEKIDAIFVVVGFDTDGNPLYLSIINKILKLGIPVWFEKPPAKNSLEIEEMLESEKEGKSFAQVGFKKMFMPTTIKAREIIISGNFGDIDTYTMRYPVDLPQDIRNLEDAGARRFLDDFVHVASTIVTLIGKPKSLMFRRSQNNGAIVTLIHHSGSVGSIHLCPKASEICPLEQLEIVGNGTNIVIDNNINITYYPKNKRLPYGRSESFIHPHGSGAEVFKPEFSLGQLYNKGLFLLGYYGEIKEFLISVRNKTRPVSANLNDALDVMQIYDAFAGNEGEEVLVDGQTRINLLSDNFSGKLSVICPNCENKMVLKDGWNYNCKKCGRMLASSELN